MVDGNVTILTNAIPAQTELFQKGSAMNNNKTSTTNQTKDKTWPLPHKSSLRSNNPHDSHDGHWAGESETGQIS